MSSEDSSARSRDCLFPGARLHTSVHDDDARISSRYAHVAVLYSLADTLATKYNGCAKNHLCLDSVGISEEASTIWPVSMISISPISIGNKLTRQPISESCCHGWLQTIKAGGLRSEPRFTRLNRSILYVAIPSQNKDEEESGYRYEPISEPQAPG